MRSHLIWEFFKALEETHPEVAAEFSHREPTHESFNEIMIRIGCKTRAEPFDRPDQVLPEAIAYLRKTEATQKT